jgi:hypothetical protein
MWRSYAMTLNGTQAPTSWLLRVSLDRPTQLPYGPMPVHVTGGTWHAASSTAEDVPLSQYPTALSADHLLALFRVVLRDAFGNAATWDRYNGGATPVVTMEAAETDPHSIAVAAEWFHSEEDDEALSSMTFVCTLTSRAARNWTLSFTADGAAVSAP